jgi:hypothetical protein
LAAIREEEILNRQGAEDAKQQESISLGVFGALAVNFLFPGGRA